MKNILIALDYDPTAQKVAELGHVLAKSMHAKTTLMHVISKEINYSTIQYPVMGFNGYMNIDPIELDPTGHHLKKISSDFLQQVKNHLYDESIQTKVTEGDAAELILETAKASAADVIVMGSHSKKWLEQILIGNVTEKVLRHTSKPMFIVPTKKTD